MYVPWVARPPGNELGLGFTVAAVHGAAAEQATRARPLGSPILENPKPPDSARYRSLLKTSSALMPRPSLVDPTFATVGEPLVVCWASVIFMMSPDLIYPTYMSL